jgi:hypothetical protein
MTSSPFAELGGVERTEARREHALLLCMARLALPPKSRHWVRRHLAQGVDWDRLTSEAERQGLTLLAQRHLLREASDLCPPSVLETLAVRARAITAVNLALTAELERVLPDLEAAGCRPVVVKGPALAMGVYGDLSSRPFDDLDVVVDEASASRAWDALEARGYVSTPPIPDRWRARWIRSTHEQLFEKPGTPLLVDLHWELTARGYRCSLALDDVRPRLTKARLGGVEAATLGPEDTLIFLCCHGMKHGWEALRWVVDVAELVRGRPEFDWDFVRRWSRPFGRRRPIQLGLHLAYRLLQAPVPAEVLADGDADPEVTALAAMVVMAFLDPVAAGSRQGVWSRTVRSVWFRGAENWADRLRHIHEWLLMPRPPDWGWLPLPESAAPLYYAVRPLRLLLKHAGGLRVR